MCFEPFSASIRYALYREPFLKGQHHAPVSEFIRLGTSSPRMTRSVEATAQSLICVTQSSPVGLNSQERHPRQSRFVFPVIYAFCLAHLFTQVNRAHVEMKEMVDPSQHGNGHFLRNFRLGGGRPVKFGLLSRRCCPKIVEWLAC